MSSIILPPFSVNAACALPEKIRPGQQIKPAENKDFFESMPSKTAFFLGMITAFLVLGTIGFFALGKSFEETGFLALKFRSMATELLMGQEKYKELLRKYHIG